MKLKLYLFTSFLTFFNLDWLSNAIPNLTLNLGVLWVCDRHKIILILFPYDTLNLGGKMHLELI